MTGFRAPLTVMPTGAGKTVLFISIVSDAILKGNRVLILVHRKELLRQASKTLTAFNIQHGIINGNYTAMYQMQVQVATVGSYVNRLDKFEPNLIIIDEAHHTPAGQWAKIVTSKPKSKIIGFTATPCRQDGKPLKGFFDIMVMGPQPGELVSLGRLMEPEIHCPELSMDLGSLEINNGEYNERQLKNLIKNSRIVGDAVALYNQICPGKTAIAFCVSIEEATKTAEAFSKAGYISKVVTGETEDKERDQAMKDLATGALQIMCTVDIVSEGTDIPAVEVGIMLRPTASTSLFIQQAGRVLRVNEGKDKAILLDLAGNVGRWINGLFFENHGLPTADREWSLEEGLKKKKVNGIAAPSVSACNKCYMSFKSGTKVCPRCGTEVQKTVQEIKIVEGELRQLEIEREQVVKKEARKEQGKAGDMESLIRLGKQRGYSAGWAKNVFEGKIISFLKKIENLQDFEKIKQIHNKFGIELLNCNPETIKSEVYLLWKRTQK
jgi:superfamily II DNA or RNA helicase/uncharacterized Zn finger protein (UPF0148 family)